MPSPRVEWREPLHYFWVLIGYDIVYVDGIVITIRHVIAVDIAVANRDRVPIRCVIHGVSKVFGERRYAIAITVSDIGAFTGFGQTRLRKEGLQRVKSLSNHLLLSKHPHTGDYET